ncbi:MAG: DinB family protein [Gemmatimonadaceae bacterium]|nr:DinB family protein [Gemmatimonadaceae bacterium]
MPLTHPKARAIAAELDRVHAELHALLATVPLAQQTTPGPNATWSIAQNILHLGMVEGSTAKLLERLIADALAAGLGADEDGEVDTLMHSLDRFGIATRAHRRVAPERVDPIGAVDPAHDLARFDGARQRLLAALASADGKDLTQLRAPHPAVGELDGYQWFLFVAQHEARHIAQMREVLA